MCMREEIYH
jgi:hypothetical protein